MYSCLAVVISWALIHPTFRRKQQFMHLKWLFFGVNGPGLVRLIPRVGKSWFPGLVRFFLSYAPPTCFFHSAPWLFSKMSYIIQEEQVSLEVVENIGRLQEEFVQLQQQVPVAICLFRGDWHTLVTRIANVYDYTWDVGWIKEIKFKLSDTWFKMAPVKKRIDEAFFILVQDRTMVWYLQKIAQLFNQMEIIVTQNLWRPRILLIVVSKVFFDEIYTCFPCKLGKWSILTSMENPSWVVQPPTSR